MNIVHVVPALTKGGAERVAVELANHAVGSGHKVTLIAGWSVDIHCSSNLTNCILWRRVKTELTDFVCPCQCTVKMPIVI